MQSVGLLLVFSDKEITLPLDNRKAERNLFPIYHLPLSGTPPGRGRIKIEESKLGRILNCKKTCTGEDI